MLISESRRFEIAVILKFLSVCENRMRIFIQAIVEPRFRIRNCAMSWFIVVIPCIKDIELSRCVVWRVQFAVVRSTDSVCGIHVCDWGVRKAWRIHCCIPRILRRS